VADAVRSVPAGDDGYDITDYYAVDPRLGTLATSLEMIRTADNLGIRVLVDLVMSHTSNQHPWFQRSATTAPPVTGISYRWSDTKQAEPSEVAFPGGRRAVDPTTMPPASFTCTATTTSCPT